MSHKQLSLAQYNFSFIKIVYVYPEPSLGSHCTPYWYFVRMCSPTYAEYKAEGGFSRRNFFVNKGRGQYKRLAEPEKSVLKTECTIKI